MSVDCEVLIIGGGMSGMGLAIQLIRKYNARSFEIIEKTSEVGGTWMCNTYPGCGCDVASHFYSYSFALNPDWSQKFSLRPEIHQYFRDLAVKYDLLRHTRFRSAVQKAQWIEKAQLWEVTIQNLSTKEIYTRRARIVISAVGSLSVPRACQLPGVDSFKGPLFHSAEWDHSLDWAGKNIIVIGNGCSATQFVPIMAQTSKSIVQFARQAHYLAERPNPEYTSFQKAVMRYVPGAMRLYRFWVYADMEADFFGFYRSSGARIRKGLKEENERYVKRMAPQKYWDALIPKHEIGCKRKVMDTDYLVTLHRDNVELVHDDPIQEIIEKGVRTRSGRVVEADAIVLATGFEVSRMLSPMEIIGENGISINQYWDDQHQGAPQAYFGTLIPGFKNFATLFGPNTTTGHLSVIYTVECQINFVLRLFGPILNDRGHGRATSVDVKESAARQDSHWLQSKLKNLVWASGCTSWALHEKTNFNVAMYPEFQFMFWLRSIFIPSQDFEYEYRSNGGLAKKSIVVGGWRTMRNLLWTSGLIGGGLLALQQTVGLARIRDLMAGSMHDIARQSRAALHRSLV